MTGVQTCALPISGRQVHLDTPFLQDYSIKYYLTDPAVQLLQVASDRNGAIRILSSDGLRKPHSGAFLYPGTIEPDNSYRPMADKKISSIGSYQDQLVYLDLKAVFSNAWAGTLFSHHGLPPANLFCGGKDFEFLVSDGTTLKLVKDSAIGWEGNLSGENILQIRYHSADNRF